MKSHRFKYKALFAACSMVAAGLMCTPALAQAGAGGVITVGVIAPHSGPIAAQGKRDINGIKAGIEYQDSVNGHKIKVIQLDDASDPSLSSRNARKLINQDHVDILIGTGGVPNTLAMAAVAKDGKTPMLSFTPVGLKPPTAEWVKCTPRSGFMMVSAVVDAMKRNGVKTVGYIGFSDAWGDIAYKALEKYAKAAGIKVVANERYARSDSSITGQTLKIIAAHPDAVLDGGAGAPGALPVIALHKRGYQGQVYGTYALIGSDFVQLVGEAGNGMLVSGGPVMVGEQLPNSSPIKTVYQAYKKAFVAANGHQPTSLYGGLAFDNWLVFLDAAKRVPTDVQPGTEAYRMALRAKINSTQSLVGTNGVYTYKPKSSFGADKASVVILELKDGKWLLRR